MTTTSVSLNATTTTTTTSSSSAATSLSSSSTNAVTDAVNANASDDPFWVKKAPGGGPERCGTGVNEKSGYYVDDRQQVKINLNAYKMVFVKGSQIFYKKNSLRRAKQVRKR